MVTFKDFILIWIDLVIGKRGGYEIQYEIASPSFFSFFQRKVDVTVEELQEMRCVWTH